jgi:hypothetical protein
LFFVEAEQESKEVALLESDEILCRWNNEVRLLSDSFEGRRKHRIQHANEDFVRECER